MSAAQPQTPPPALRAGARYRDFWNALAILVAVVLVELALLQIFAIAATTGIYHLAPQLDVGSPRGFRDWLTILQVVSATLTLPGGTAIVLSTWLAARWGRMYEQQRADYAQQFANAQQQRADAAEQHADTAEQRANTAEQHANAQQQRADTAEQRFEAFQQEAKKWHDEAVAARASADSAQSRISDLESQIATLQAAVEQRPRHRRRQLRR